MINFQRAEFVRSAVKVLDFPSDNKRQIVFAGRSNVGKSSLINTLLNRKNFARVGNTPGKTVHINFFDIDDKLWFVDLPGYGYAKVSEAEKKRWGKLLEEYFAHGSIGLGILIVDIRHKPTADDRVMANWFYESGIPVLVAANKADKLKKNQIEPALEMISRELSVPDGGTVIPFSAEKGDGKDLLLKEIIMFYEGASY